VTLFVFLTTTYEQKDPLLIYKFESFNLFKQMINDINKEIVSFLMKGNLPISNPDHISSAQNPEKTDMSKLQTSRAGMEMGAGQGQGQQKEPKKAQPVRVEKKVGRNEPCPCGSGKKYKQCHGKQGV
jgi:preprotein translocase subunit SecA